MFHSALLRIVFHYNTNYVYNIWWYTGLEAHPTNLKHMGNYVKNSRAFWTVYQQTMWKISALYSRKYQNFYMLSVYVIGKLHTHTFEYAKKDVGNLLNFKAKLLTKEWKILSSSLRIFNGYHKKYEKSAEKSWKYASNLIKNYFINFF